jgi:DDE superfamily endonuclease
MPARSLPDTLAALLVAFAPLLHRPDLPDLPGVGRRVPGQPGLRTVTGMLTAAGLAGRRHHDLAYRLFASAGWCPDQLGLVLLDLITAVLVTADAPIVLAVDTLWRRTGRKIHGTAWHHDGGDPGRHRPAWGHRWVSFTSTSSTYSQPPWSLTSTPQHDPETRGVETFMGSSTWARSRR